MVYQAHRSVVNNFLESQHRQIRNAEKNLIYIFFYFIVPNSNIFCLFFLNKNTNFRYLFFIRNNFKNRGPEKNLATGTDVTRRPCFNKNLKMFCRIRNVEEFAVFIHLFIVN
jgi:hypothetical protein